MTVKLNQIIKSVVCASGQMLTGHVYEIEGYSNDYLHVQCVGEFNLLVYKTCTIMNKSLNYFTYIFACLNNELYVVTNPKRILERN